MLIKSGVSNALVEVDNVEEIPSGILEALDCGDTVVKISGGQKHNYKITYKQDKVGICLTYIDADNVETISYGWNGETKSWDFNSKNITPISSFQDVELAQDGTISTTLGLNSSGKLVKETLTKLTVGDLFPLTPIKVGQNEDESKYAYFSDTASARFMNEVADSGLFILMFNHTTVIIPYVVNSANNFVVSAIYNSSGSSMVARAKLTIDKTSRNIRIDFDSNYASQLYDNPTVRPTAVVRFLSF